MTRSIHQPAELVTSQMGALSDPLADVVDLLTVAGPLDCDLLAEIVGFPAVDEAQARGLVALEHDANRAVARLGHPLCGEVRRSKASVCGRDDSAGALYRS